MKVVLLAGGLGTRISEESVIKPKPMIEIGEKPILWHIMKIYSQHGFNDFVVCLGYKAYVIKEYFANYFLHESDVTFDFRSGNKMTIHGHTAEPWTVTLVDTGLATMTGGRLKRVQKFVGDEPFMMTYGDGVSNIDVKALVEYHKKHGKIATLTATQPRGRFGALELSGDNKVLQFQEKPKGDRSWINAGFFVFQPDVFKYIADDSTVFEKEPMEKLAAENQLLAYKHSGFWQPMDSLRDKNQLEEFWRSGAAPWKVWRD